MGDRIRQLRLELDLTQGELARRAGVSRQLIGALEAGRHLPRVDAAISIASALATDVPSLFGPVADSFDVVSGDSVEEGEMIRLGRVGETTVHSVAGVGSTGWHAADAIVEGGRLKRLSSIAPGVVMVGCEPGLGVLEETLREGSRGGLSVTCSTGAAIRALREGRAHLAVVHGESPDESDAEGLDVTRYHLCSWRVGLAGPAEQSGWVDEALDGRVEVAQREEGAGVQLAFERAAPRPVRGPLVGGHVEAARLAATTGMPAVTIEPAAVAFGADFHSLETHRAEVWVSRSWVGDSGVEAVMNEIVGERFRRRLAGVGAYDLSGIGGRAA